jgi:hypothetical protein
VLSVRQIVVARRIVVGIALTSILIAASACQKRPQTEPWFIHARRYIEADAQMLRGATQVTFSQNYELREKARSLLQREGAPSLATLDTLLRSSDDLDRKAALVVIMVRKTSADELFTTIVSRAQPSDDFFVKFYRQHCLENLSNPQVATLTDQLTSMFAAENDEVIIIAGMPTVIRLDRAKARHLLVRYMKTGTPSLRRMTNIFINKAGDGLFEEIKAALEQDNAVDALKFLQRTS